MPSSLVILAVTVMVLLRRAIGSSAAPYTVAGKTTWTGIVLRYGSALPIVALAVVLRWRLEETVGPLPTFILFYPAVLLVASVAGGGPGILATVLAALAADYWFIPPYRILSR